MEFLMDSIEDAPNLFRFGVEFQCAARLTFCAFPVKLAGPDHGNDGTSFRQRVIEFQCLSAGRQDCALAAFAGM